MLQHARVLVPVVAVLGEVEVDEAGLAHDKTSDMATVLMRRAATGVRRCSRSPAPTRCGGGTPRPDPSRCGVPDAARAAVHDGADALLLDVAGPVMVVVEGEDLRALADGFVLADVAGRLAWVKPS